MRGTARNFNASELGSHGPQTRSVRPVCVVACVSSDDRGPAMRAPGVLRLASRRPPRRDRRAESRVQAGEELADEGVYLVRRLHLDHVASLFEDANLDMRRKSGRVVRWDDLVPGSPNHLQGHLKFL